MLRRPALILLCSVCCYGTFALGQAPDTTGSTPAPKAPPTPVEQLSDAERTVRLERGITEGEQKVTELKAKLDDPDSEYNRAKTEFAELDQNVQELTKKLSQLQKAGQKNEAAAVQTELDGIRKRHELSKNRLDLAIEERKTFEKTIATLEQKIQQDREALAKLLAPPKPATQPAATSPSPVPQGTEPPAASPEPPAAVPVPGAMPPSDQAQPESTPTPKPTAPPSKELLEAQEKAQVKEAEAQKAEQEVQSLTERIETLREQIANETELVRTARKKAANARETQRTLSDQARTQSAEGAPQAEVNQLWQQVAEAQQRSQEAQAALAEHVDRRDAIQADLQALQTEEINALRDAEKKREQAKQAAKVVEKLENPFSVANLLKWVTTHGPRVLGIIVGMFVLLWLARVADKHIVRLLAGRAEHGSRQDREDRAKTLVSVFRNVATIVIVAGGILMILAEIGLNIVPLMGGVAVVGLAVAFGAQSLIKDYFSGFMILLENQYGINDVVKIGDKAGLVERISLRMTVLRDLQGTLHFIPHGQADVVSNMTHGWSRAVLDIGIAYKEDVDRVMDVLSELGRELHEDAEFGPLMLDYPEMLGVDAFDDSAVVIKLIIKTRPLKQWAIKREMLRRVKNKFDELGIEIPFPHRVVFHRHEEEAPTAPSPTDETSDPQ